MTVKSADAVDVAVGLRVRARRVALGVAQERLAAALGITFQQVQKYEKAANRISAGRLAAIAGALSCPVSELLPDDLAAQVESTPASRFAATREFAALAAIFDRIPDPARRRRLVSVLEALLPLVTPEAA